MDNLGDWLYIIIIIIAAISSFFSSLKKKKRPAEVLGQPGYDDTPQRPTNEKGFWELFEEELKESPAPPPPPVSRVVKPERSVKSKYDLKDVNINKYATTGPILQESQEEESYGFSEDTFHDTDEIRKAIIYTEILKRKY